MLRVKSDATVSLADAGEITSPSEDARWKRAMEESARAKKREPEESGREVSSKREHGRQKQWVVSV